MGIGPAVLLGAATVVSLILNILLSSDVNGASLSVRAVLPRSIKVTLGSPCGVTFNA